MNGRLVERRISTQNAEERAEIQEVAASARLENRGTWITLLGRMKKVGSYVLLGEIASGGMASVHLGRLSGPAGFSRTVAIKRLHPQFAKDPEFVSMFLDEARVAARIRHPNVVQTLDVVAADGELFLVMDYVEGEALSRLLKRLSRQSVQIPLPIVSSIVSGALRGLHAAHEAKGEVGEPLEIVHRDVSPQNVMLGSDGVVRVLDFGIAKAVGRLQTTREGAIKGKLPYMAPEQLRGLALSSRTDVYAVGVVLWECLVGDRLFTGDEAHVVERILLGTVPAPSTRVPNVPPSLDAIVARATARAPSDRYASAAEMAVALENAVRPALPSEIATWLDHVAGASLRTRAARVHEQLQGGNAAGDAPILTPVSLESAIRESRRQPREGREVEDAPAKTELDPSETGLGLDAPRPAVSRRTVAVASFAVACVFGFGVAAWRYSADGADPADAQASTTLPIASAIASAVADPVGVPSTSAEPVAVAEGAPDAGAGATGASAKPIAASKAGAGTKAKPIVKPQPKPPRVDCSIPYTIDSTGKRVYRRECLK